MFQRFNPHIFVGPTVNDALYFGPLDLAGFVCHPPARRGDIETLSNTHSPGVLVIVDGLFHSSLAIGHAEIREAVLHGWRVWGLSSIGAIRAFEMRHCGVRGYGKTFAYFAGAYDFTDDEVALLHGEGPGYYSFSEPLVHLRLWVYGCVEQRLVSKRTADSLVETLQCSWYGTRSLSFVKRFLQVQSGMDGPAVDSLFKLLPHYRVKGEDLFTFVRDKVWQENEKNQSRNNLL
jgi:hypothetical protein